MAGDGAGGEASAKKTTGKNRVKRGPPQNTNTEFLFTRGQILSVVAVVAVLIVARFFFDDGTSKSTDSDDVLDGQDLYEVLEIKKESTDKEVKKAYRTLAMKWHPDKIDWAKTPGAKINFERITKAYDILSDPMKRGIYDKEQKLMEKSIQSNTVAISTANYDELVKGQGIWLIQTYVDWSDRCQYFSAMWEEVGNRLQGAIGIGRVNFGRDKGLGARLMGKRDIPPSVAIFDGEEELRRLRWEFHDVTVDGIVKLVAQAVAERYKARVINEAKQLEEWVRADTVPRLLFIGKAGCREQILSTAQAGQLGGLSIATTSKMSIGTLAVANVKPPCLLVYRGHFGEGPEVYTGRWEGEEVGGWLRARQRLTFPLLHQHNFHAVCGGQTWCSLAVGKTSDLKTTAKTLLLQAAAKVEGEIDVVLAVGGLEIATQSGAAAMVGAAEGDIVLLERTEHHKLGAGEGRLRMFVIKAADAREAETLGSKLVSTMRGTSSFPKEGHEAQLLQALLPPSSSILEVVGEALSEMSVEKQILLYTLLLFAGLFAICPCLKPLILAADRALHPPPPPSERGGEEEEEESEEEEEDVVLVKKKRT